MKRLINPLPIGGVPYTNEDFLTLQNEGFDALKQILVGLNSAMVLSGCTTPFSASTNLLSNDFSGFVVGSGTGGGSSIESLSAGYVWIDGDIKYFPGTTLAAPFYIKSDTASYSRKTLQDGTQKNVYVQTDAIATTTRPLSGQYITCSPSPNLVFKDFLTTGVRAALSAEASTRQTQMAAEVTARTNGDTQLNQRINTLTDTVDTKAAKRCERIDWTDIPLQNGFVSNNFQLQRAQYMRDEFGFAHLRGHIVHPTQYDKNNTYGGALIAMLPQGVRPTLRAQFTFSLLENFYNSCGPKAFALTYNYLVVQDNGGFSLDTVYQLNDPDNRVSATQGKSYQTIHLDGWNYYCL